MFNTNFNIFSKDLTKCVLEGLDQFSQLFCDPKLWMQQGWVDMIQPQLYWRIDPPAQSYPILLNWWIGAAQNPLVRPVMAGNYLTRVDTDAWPLDEIRRQVELNKFIFFFEKKRRFSLHLG